MARIQAYLIEEMLRKYWIQRRGQMVAAWPIAELEWLFSRLQFKQKARTDVVQKHRAWLEATINGRLSLAPQAKNALCWREDIRQLLLDVGCLAEERMTRQSKARLDVELKPGVRRRIHVFRSGAKQVFEIR